MNTAPFTKQVQPGMIPPYNGSRRERVFIDIRWDGTRLSISGVVGPRATGNCLGSCGQVQNSLTAALENSEWKYADGWNAATIRQLLEVWDRWHLNDMRAGSPRQMAHLETVKDQYPGYPVSHYDWAREQLAAVDLDPDTEHDDYKYGHAWLTEEVPADVIEWLAALPASPTVSPWGPPR